MGAGGGALVGGAEASQGGGVGGAAGRRRKKKKREQKEQELGRAEGETSNRNLSASIAPRGYHRAANPPRVNGGRPNRCDSTRHAAGAASVLFFFFHRSPATTRACSPLLNRGRWARTCARRGVRDTRGSSAWPNH